MSSSVSRTLVAIPTYNEEASVADVVSRVRSSLPEFDLLVVNDGSQDRTEAILRDNGVATTTHLCNLGYGRAIQTAIKYAIRQGYDTLITLDADGQHHPEQIREMLAVCLREEWDCMVGSRYVKTQAYGGAPLGRRVGMQFFSLLTKLAIGRRIYDTTSGLKVMRRSVFAPLIEWHFVDFHAEAIVYLARIGFRVGEFPITIAERRHGESMYSAVSHIVYPLKTATMVLLGAIQADLTRRKMR
jgi:glycosyltransferase involved in cell wall biosynthesis